MTHVMSYESWLWKCKEGGREKDPRLDRTGAYKLKGEKERDNEKGD